MATLLRWKNPFYDKRYPIPNSYEIMQSHKLKMKQHQQQQQMLQHQQQQRMILYHQQQMMQQHHHQQQMMQHHHHQQMMYPRISHIRPPPPPPSSSSHQKMIKIERSLLKNVDVVPTVTKEISSKQSTSLKQSKLNSLSMRFVPITKRNVFVEKLPDSCTVLLPRKSNEFVLVDSEPEIEGICRPCEFFDLIDNTIAMQLKSKVVLNQEDLQRKDLFIPMSRFTTENLMTIQDLLLNRVNMENKWILLLWAEQLQIEIDIRNYDLHDIPLKQRSSFVQTSQDKQYEYTDWIISVPDAPEQRPLVYVGMRVLLRPSLSRFDTCRERLQKCLYSSERFVSPSCSFCAFSLNFGAQHLSLSISISLSIYLITHTHTHATL